MLRIQGWMEYAETRKKKIVDGCDVEKWRLFALDLFQGWQRRERRDLREIR
jgi:hypothetical protein